MMVRVIKKCYYKDRMREEGSIIDFDEADKDKGVYRAGDKKGKSKPEMPSWAEIVDSGVKEKEPDDEEQEPTTLHEMAENKKPNLSKPGKRKAK